MNQPTSAALPSSPCLASVLLNLPGYRVTDVVRDDGDGDGDGDRTVRVASTATEGACPSCGVLTRRVHQRTMQRLRGVPFDGVITVQWVKRRWRCGEVRCPRTSFTEHTAQVPPRARMTTRLRDALVDAVAGEARPVERVAAQFAVSWPTVMRQLTAAMATVAAQRRGWPRLVRRLGIDEHRFRTVRWFRDPHEPTADPARWRRVEPWMTCMVDLSSGNVIDLVDGRDSAAVRASLEAQPKWWRRRVEVVAIDPSAAFRSAVRRLLPKARVSVDHFHLVKLANDMLTAAAARSTWPGRTGCCSAVTTPSPRAAERGSTTSSPPTTPRRKSAPPGASRSNSAWSWPAPPWPTPRPLAEPSTSTSAGQRCPRPPN